MKQLILLVLFLITIHQLTAQHFSGQITYKHSIEPKNKNVDIETLLQNQKGEIATYLITDKYYKSSYLKAGKETYSYTYHDETKRMYDFYWGRDYITYRDSRKANVKDLGSTIYRDSTITILGRTCFAVVSKTDRATTTTYYSNDIKINYQSFEGHKVGDWYNQLKQLDGCITIKSITEFDDHYEIQEAIKIEERPVAKNEFDLPKLTSIIASSGALDTQVEMIQPDNKAIDCYQSKLSIIKSGNEKYISYIKFVLTKEGDLKFIEPYEKDKMRFYRIAIDIVTNCGFKFKPGLINEQAVDSEVYFPIEFSFQKK